MTAIPPSTPQLSVAALPQAVAGAAVATVVSSNIPPQLSSLELRALVDATVLGTGSAAGTVQVMLKGAESPVTLRLTMPLPAQGAVLTLQLVAQGAMPQLRLVSVDGQPVTSRPGTPTASSPAQIPAAAEQDVTTSIPQTGAAGGTPRPTYEATLFKTGLPPSVGQDLLQTDLPDLPSGSVLTIRVASSAPPSPEAAEFQLPPDPPDLSKMPGSVPADGKAGAQTGPALSQQAQTEASAPSSSSFAPPADAGGGQQGAPNSAAPAPSASPLPQQSFTGVVAANSNNGLPLILTPFGLLGLDAPLGLPAGSRVVFDLLETAPPQPSTDANPADGARAWPALSETVQALRTIAPSVLHQLSERLPELGPHLALGLIAFAAAATKGELWKWLGEAPAQALEKARRPELARALESEMGQVSGQVFVSPNGEEWLAWMAPLLVDGRLERFRMMARRHASGEERARSSGDGARFLLDLDLSATGKMQIDGLVKRDMKRFDLIVRTYSALSQEMRSDIRGIFARSLDGMGFSGEALFQQTTHFVEPVPVAGAAAAVEI